jgi:hypothetical protein
MTVDFPAAFLEDLIDACVAFPEMNDFSRANLLYMRAFAEAWFDPVIVQQPVGRLSWRHNIVLLTRLKSPVRWVRETGIYDTRQPGKTRL